MSVNNDFSHHLLHRQRAQELVADAHRRRLAKSAARRSRNRQDPAAGDRTTSVQGDGSTSEDVTMPSTSVPQAWNVTPSEVAAEYPCDRLVPMPVQRWTRGIDIEAPATVVFRWLCQLREAPYSYDWIDNLGRRSPRTLTSGAEALATGQRLLIADITDFAEDEHLTGRAIPAAERLYGVVALSYHVTPTSPTTSRLVVRLLLHPPTHWWQAVRTQLLAWGDLIMMRKQLITLKELAEQTARDLVPASHVGPGTDENSA